MQDRRPCVAACSDLGGVVGPGRRRDCDGNRTPHREHPAIGACSRDAGRPGTGDASADHALRTYCEPVLRTLGRHRRTCRDVPPVRMLFVGYGIFGPQAAVARAWKPQNWSMWIDGERVSLDEFGTADRMLWAYPPAGGKDVTLREWSVILAHPTPGRHTIRYQSASRKESRTRPGSSRSRRPKRASPIAPFVRWREAPGAGPGDQKVPFCRRLRFLPGAFSAAWLHETA